MKRLSLPAAFGVVLALLFAGLGGAPAFAGSNPVPIYLKADPCPGASLCGNFLTGQFKGSGKRTTQFAALPNLTVTRASFAYGENADGSLKGFQAGQARVTSKGLGVFEATTTLNLWSQDFTNAAWSTFAGAAKVGAAPVADPAGGSTAYEVSFGSTGGTLGSASAIFQSVTMSANTTYSGCFYVRAKTGSTTIRVSITDNASVTNGTGDTLVTTAWSRICTTQTISASPAGNNLALRNNTAGTSANVYVAFADLRLGAYPVPYCPTTSSTATCAADSSVGFGSYVFGSSGTVVASYLQPAGSFALVSRVIGSSTGSTAPIYISSTVAGGQGTQAAATFNGTNSLVAPIYQSTVTPGRLVTAATAWTGSSRLVYSNGAQTASDANAGGFGTGLWLGSDNGSAQFLNGYITAFAVYPSAFSAAQLQAATQGPDTSFLSLNFASGLYKTTTPYVRTNWVRNSTMVGAGAGAHPTGWIANGGSNLAWSAVGVATENGLSCVDERLSGTANATGASTLLFGAINDTAAANGQTWTAAVTGRLVAGSLTNITATTLVGGTSTNGTTISATFVATNITLTGVPTRYFASGAAGASVTNAVEYFQVTPQVGAVDATFRLCAPMMEQTAYPSSWIPTTGLAASTATSQSTNAADIGALTFTNSAGGYAQFSNGTLQWFPANTPRCTDQGCLIEEAATNLETYSQDSSQWTPTNVVVTTGQLAPDGTATAFQVSSTANLNSFVASPIITLANNTTYTSSLYFKPVSGTGVIAIEYTTGTTLVGPTCNALTGSTTNGAVITTYGNGWSRCTVTFTTAATGTPSARVAYVGAYGATATPTTVLLWQKDIVAKAFATSPIPTTSASATRSADVMSYAYTPPTTGTLATSWSAPITPADQFPAFLSDGTLNNRVHFAQSATTGNLNAVVNNGGAVTSFSTANVVTGSGVACGALSYTGGAQIASLNGGTNATAAGATIPTTLSTLTVGGGGAATAARQLNGYVRDVAVFAYAANSNETPYRAACNF